MVFKNLCVLVLWIKEDLALERLREFQYYPPYFTLCTVNSLEIHVIAIICVKMPEMKDNSCLLPLKEIIKKTNHNVLELHGVILNNCPLRRGRRRFYVY